MAGEMYSCRTASCPAFEDLVEMLSEARNTSILDEYTSLLEDDPEYLTFHWISTALKLQFHLKRHSVPALDIGACIDESSRGCCVVDALKEAILRRSTKITPDI